jgi:predicted dehydrogenase
MNIGIIGLGVIAKYYITAFEKGVGHNLTAVCDLDQNKMLPFNGSATSCYLDYEQMLKESTLDAVIINLPNDLHFTVCQRALEMGKHVCCEKPLTLDVEQAIALRQTATKYGKTLFTSFHRRYNTNFLALLKEIPNHGAIAHVELNYKEKIEEHAGNDTWYLEPQKCGGGALADNGPNAFDTAAFFLGPLTVIEADAPLNAQGVDLQAKVLLQNEQDIPVVINLDWNYAHGELKDVIVQLRDGRVLRADLLEGYHQFKSSLFHEYESIIFDYVECIKRGDQFGDDGIHAVELVSNAYQLAASAEAFA